MSTIFVLFFLLLLKLDSENEKNRNEKSGTNLKRARTRLNTTQKKRNQIDRCIYTNKKKTTKDKIKIKEKNKT